MHPRFTLNYESPAFHVPPRRRRRRESPVACLGEWLTLAVALGLTAAGFRALALPSWHDVHAHHALAFAAAATVGIGLGAIALHHDPHEHARLAALGILLNLVLALTALLVCACCLIG
jgi:hypothetical protein